MKVVVIGWTHFCGVPEELLTDWGKNTSAIAHDMIKALGQDKGSDGARLIECAGRTCYDSYSRGRNSEAFHKNILEVGHGSVLEHTVINFFISGISRGCSHELVRHRAGTAFSQRSTRYVDESKSAWAWHPIIDAAMTEYMMKDNYECSEAHRVEDTLIDTRQMCQEAYLYLVEWLTKYLEQYTGVDKHTARKQARGAARGALGNALETEMVFSANVRALRHIIEMRASEFADAEIRLLANELLIKATEVVPEYFVDYTVKPCSDGIGFAISTPHRKI